MSTSSDFSLVGGQEIDRLLQTLSVKIEKNILRASLRAGAVVFLAEVKQRIPAVSGDLRKSARITTRQGRGQVSASVKVGNKKVYYAQMVEFGTRPHVISVTDVDRGINQRTGRLVSLTTINRSLRLGGTLVGPSVKHPGARPHPYARPAADAAAPIAIAAFQAKLRERMTEEGLNTPAPIPADPPT